MQFRLSISLTCLLTLSLNLEAFDCKKARTPMETAICQDTQLKQLDDKLNSHYRSLMAFTSDKKSLTALQVEWIKQRDSACARTTEVKSCLKLKYNERIAQLAITPKNNGYGALMPIFASHRCNQKGEANINYAAYKFIHPIQKGEIAFNKAIEKLWLEANCNQGNGNDYYAQLTMSPPFITSKLISARYEGDRCEGICAGTRVFTSSIHLNMATGDQLTFEDLFNSAAVNALANSCLNSLEQKHGDILQEVSVTLSDIADATTDLRFWHFDATNAYVKFSPYTIAPGAYGFMECDLDQNIVRKHIKPSSPWNPNH